MWHALEPAPGFWGTPTSSVDWCEANYVHSFYVAELFNTISSLAMTIAGVIGLALHARLLERRFAVAYCMLALVGLGSAAFHASLRFELQMLDELPMLYLAIVMLYILLENRPARRFGAWFPLLLVAHAALVTYLCAFTRGRLQFWAFQLSFSSAEFLGLYLVYRLYRASGSAELRRLFRAGFVFYGLALVLWFTDLRFCHVLQALARHGIPNPQFHAIWHVLVSVGFYLLLLVIAHDRLRVLGRRSRVRFRAFVPHLG